jgi:hypothetical protein
MWMMALTTKTNTDETRIGSQSAPRLTTVPPLLGE